jgi:class 3 adenylate cyclase
LPYALGSRWESTLQALDEWFIGRPARRLFRLNPLSVARELGLDPGTTIDAFLAGVLEGWLDLRWDFHCPQCGGIPHHSSRLSEARAGGECANCHTGFHNALDHNVEVTFSAAPRLATFQPGEQDELLASYHMSLLQTPWTAVKRLSGLDLLHRPLFHERFSDDVLSADENLEIRQVVFLFTDIKGSTALYEQLGDAKAYNLVRDHFKVLFEAVEKNQGVVVKTIGDAVMASFLQPSLALEAALTVHQTIDTLKVPGTDESVVVKMGIHSGPAIAVTLNQRFDYFGQTVNKAARIQGLAQDQEIYFSEAVFQDAASRKTLTSRKAAVRRYRAHLKGIEGDQVVYAIQ